MEQTKTNQEKKLRILLNTNSPWTPSGYGVQASHLLPLFREAGYAIACSCFFGLEGGKIEWQGIPMYPKMASPWGEDCCVMHGKDFGADVVMTLQDIWCMDFNAMRNVNRWIAYVPIDHTPTPPGVIDHLRMCYRIITMSKFGHDQLLKEGFHSTYIPHMVDTDKLKPQDKVTSKRMLGVPEDAFLVGMVGANKENPPRKGFQEAIDAFKKFHDVYPNSYMYFHAWINQPGGFDIGNYCNFLGLTDYVKYVDTYNMWFKFTTEDMSHIYSAFDVLIESSMSEGFGVPVAEAQACGTPVIVNELTSLPELVIPGKTGYIAKHGKPRFGNLLSMIFPADENAIFNALVDIKKKPLKAEDCRQHIVENYEKNLVFKKYWVPFLETLENEIHPLATP